MAINFTSNIDAFTTASRNSRTKNFQEFASKKKLEEANVLPQDQLDFVKQIRGTFTFALHTAGKYMVVTLYHANAEKKYQFIIVNLQNKKIAECDSVKNAKAEVMNLVAEEAHTEEATAETTENEEIAPVEASDSQPSRRRNRKEK